MDFVLIEQVIINLLENAIKFSPPSAPIEISVHSKDGEYQVSIADDGPGIPENDLERIFDKFYRVRRKDNPPGDGARLVDLQRNYRGPRWTDLAKNRPDGGACSYLPCL